MAEVPGRHNLDRLAAGSRRMTTLLLQAVGVRFHAGNRQRRRYD
jgi:hypothetical protein